MLLTHTKIQERFENAMVPDFWKTLLYKRLSAKSVLATIGVEYHAMLNQTDIRMMSEGQQRFVRMVMQFPPEWKRNINVYETWSEVSALLQINLNTLSPSEVKAKWPRTVKVLIPVFDHCTMCKKPTRIGCTIEQSEAVRLCRKCCGKHGLNGDVNFETWARLVKDGAGLDVGNEDDININTTIEELLEQQPTRFQYFHQVKFTFKPNVPGRKCLNAMMQPCENRVVILTLREMK